MQGFGKVGSRRIAPYFESDKFAVVVLEKQKKVLLAGGEARGKNDKTFTFFLYKSLRGRSLQVSLKNYSPGMITGVPRTI